LSAAHVSVATAPWATSVHSFSAEQVTVHVVPSLQVVMHLSTSSSQANVGHEQPQPPQSFVHVLSRQVVPGVHAVGAPHASAASSSLEASDDGFASPPLASNGPGGVWFVKSASKSFPHPAAAAPTANRAVTTDV